jgi:hypothetical protein
VAIVNNPLNYLHDAFKQMIPPIKFKFVSPKKIEDVSSLKMRLLWLWWNFNKSPEAKYSIYLITIDSYM